MANEVIIPFTPSQTIYFQIFNNKTSQVWNTSGGTGALETYVSANYSVYSISATALGTASSSRFYTGNFPTAIPAGTYSVLGYAQQGGSPAEPDLLVAAGDIEWNGSAPLGLPDLATSGQVGAISPLRIARGTMIQNFPFKLVSSTDHVTPLTSGLVSGQISRDGGAFGGLQSGAASGGVAFTELGKGWYSLLGLTSGDLLANTVALTFTAAGISGGASDQRDFAFVLQRTSGQT